VDRRTFVKQTGATLLVSFLPRSVFANQRFSRCRPADANWPSAAAWSRLKNDVEGNLIPVEFPIAACMKDADSGACKEVLANIKNPYYIGDQPGLTQTLGWVDAWFTKPSVYAVTARRPEHIAAAVNFARENDLRLVVKGGGHSYQGTSNAPDSLLVWTRYMHDINMHDAFVPHGCKRAIPSRAVTCGSGAIWMQAYEAVTTRGGAYVQGGGCTTVGVAGLVQSGGFGSFSKHYGTAAANLLEAEVVTADGTIRIATACSDPDLFWALKGGGGGSFGIVNRVSLRVHELPEFFGAALFQVRASSDAAFRSLVRQFVGFYRDQLFNDHWGETVSVSPRNVLSISMVSHGLSTDEAKKAWRPFLDWVDRSRGDFTIPEKPTIASVPARKWWDVEWWRENHLDVFVSDSRPGANSQNVWWSGDGGQVAWTIYGFESLWLPQSLLRDDAQERLTSALFAGSRDHSIQLHFNKGLAGAPREAMDLARSTAMHPSVLNAFALAIVADAGGGYPGINGHEPDVAAARMGREQVRQCMQELRAVAPAGGAYVSESNFFERDWQHSYWGNNYDRLAQIKKKYDPSGLFFVHNGVGSEAWTEDGFTKI
jgi:FAD/FMN-containing dehydrogenase